MPLPLCFFLLLLCTCVRAQTEAAYIRALADHLDARTEVAVTSGRVDLVTAVHAIEVERAPKWKNSIGQALWYSLQTNKRPGIVLLIERPADRKYAIQLGAALLHGGLEHDIDVWLWPDDFPGVTPTAATPQPDGGSGPFWLNTSSNKRHTADCQHFQNTARGRRCAATEGTPAGCCH